MSMKYLILNTILDKLSKIIPFVLRFYLKQKPKEYIFDFHQHIINTINFSLEAG